MKAPQWAEEMSQQALEYLGCKLRPELVWSTKNSFYTSGKARLQGKRYVPVKRFMSGGKKFVFHERRKRNSQIRIVQGTDLDDAKMCLLHEVAHIATPKGHNHSIQFYRTAWKLYKHFGLDLERCLKREGRYKKTAIKQYEYLKSIGEL
jgi:hypothetical protein